LGTHYADTGSGQRHTSGAESHPAPLLSKIATLQQTIGELALEKGRLEAELRRSESASTSLFGTRTPEQPRAVLPPREKIALFLELFGARRDVYPKFWENPGAGKKGYSPADVTDHSTGFQKRFLPDVPLQPAHPTGHRLACLKNGAIANEGRQLDLRVDHRRKDTQQKGAKG